MTYFDFFSTFLIYMLSVIVLLMIIFYQVIEGEEE